MPVEPLPQVLTAEMSVDIDVPRDQTTPGGSYWPNTLKVSVHRMK